MYRHLPTSKTQPQDYAKQLNDLRTQTANLEQQVRSRDATARDLAIAVEINQKYIDILDELLDAEFPTDTSVTVAVDEQNVRFKDANGFTEWLVELLNG